MKFHALVVAASFAFGLVLAASPAAAECDPDTSIYEDEFDFMDPSWGDPDDSLYVEDDKLVIHSYTSVVNFNTLNKGGNVCVDMTIADATKIANSPIGLIFWWKDWDNYYSLFIWADGWIEVRRKVNGEQKALFTEEVPLALKSGVGETNNVELKLNPKDATIIINGTEVKRFKGRPPAEGGVVGFYGVSPEDAPATFTFDNFVVNETAP